MYRASARASRTSSWFQITRQPLPFCPPCPESFQAIESNAQGLIGESESRRTAGVIGPIGGKLFLGFVYLVGALILGASHIRAWVHKRKIYHQIDQELAAQMQPNFDRVKKQMGLKNVRLWVTDAEIAPAAFGIFRPTIALPSSIARTATARELEILFIHELNHVLRRDAIAASLQTVAVCLWWFHPLVWMLSKRISRIREYCCDLETIARNGIQPKEYCHCLLNLVRSSRPVSKQIGLGISPFLDIKRRFENVMYKRKVNTLGTPAPLKLLVIAFAAMSLPGAAGWGGSPDPAIQTQNNSKKRTSDILYVTEAGIARIDVQKLTPTIVFPRHQQMAHPTVSPDGSSLAHASWLNNERRVWVAIGSNKPLAVSPDHEQEFIEQISWSPNGKWIAYRTQSTQKSSVYLVRPDGTEHHEIKPYDGRYSPGLEHYGEFCWSPDGNSLAIAKVVEITTNRFGSMLTVERKWRHDSQSLLVHVTGGRTPTPPGVAPAFNKVVDQFLIVSLTGESKGIPVDFEIWHYDWHPDRDSIVTSGGNREIVEIQRDGTSTVLADNGDFWGQVQVLNSKEKRDEKKH